MNDELFESVKAALPECNKLPDEVKEILNIATNSLKDLNESDSKLLWIFLHNFMKETSVSEDITKDKELISCYKCVLKLICHLVTCAENILIIYADDHLLKTVILFQSFYVKNFKYKFKLEIANMCFKFWELVTNSLVQKLHETLNTSSVMTENIIVTFNYLFDTIKVTTKKFDMQTLCSLLRKLCKVSSTLFSNKTLSDYIILNLEGLLKQSLFLQTEPGKLCIANIFTTSRQLFLKFHQIIKYNIPKAKKLEAEAYGEIYFMAWLNSNESMREVIEQEGIFDLISKTLTLQRSFQGLRTFHNASMFLQSMQNHRKHLKFSKVITNLYAPVLWRHLSSEFSIARCNAIEILARAYPLEKRGEGREVSSRFLIKQQDAFLDLLEDPVPQVRITAIKGVCSCMRYFWDTFEDDRIQKCFSLFVRLIDDSIFEVRRAVYYGFCQLLDEHKSHSFLKTPLLMAKMKNALYDDNEKVRRAFLNFLLKIKKIDQSDNTEKINFATILNLHGAAIALAREDEQNGHLLVDLIFDNFIGDKVPDRHTTLQRFFTFYKINPTALRKLMIFSDKHLEFDDACQLILSLLKTLYGQQKKKEDRLKDTNKENDIPTKKRKLTADSDMNETNVSTCSSSVDNEVNEDNDHTNVCCMLDCVNCLMLLHRNRLMDEKNHQKMKDIQDSCATCLIKLLKFYKEGDAYFSAMSLASLIPLSKLSAHVSVSSAALSTLKLLPYDVKCAEEEIDMRKVNCLVYTLCMWKRGYEVLQFVNVWIDEAFKTLNLNESQYPESKSHEGKRVRFKTDIEECKPMTGILLINSMLTNLQVQDTLVNSDVNKKNMYDLIVYLQRIKPAIENRISTDNILSNLVSDEVLIELFHLNMRLHIFYHARGENSDVDEIIKYQTSTLDWVINNLLIHDLHSKNDRTITFLTKTIDVVNNIVLNCCLMSFVNNTFLDNYFTFCTSLLQNHIGPRVLISMIATICEVLKHLNYQKYVNNLLNDLSILTNHACSIISIFSESMFNEERFKSVIGDPTKFRSELVQMISELNKISKVEFEQVFTVLIETIMNINANKIREFDEIDLNEQLTEMPFSAYQLVMVILNNAKLRKHFSCNAVIIFSSEIYKNDSIMLLSAISFVHTLSFQLNKTKMIALEPVVKLLYKTLVEHEKTSMPLSVYCTIINPIADQEKSVLETSDFSHEINYKQKGRDILIATAKQLRITLCD